MGQRGEITMFIGEYQHSIDHKGRIAIPVKFRPKLAEGCVITRGLDNSLFIYTNSEWEKLADNLSKLPISQSDARAFSRLMFSGAADLEIDKQGRIVIPSFLRSFAGLKSEVIICGLYNRLEVWDRVRWDEYKKESEKESTDIAEHLGDLGV